MFQTSTTTIHSDEGKGAGGGRDARREGRGHGEREGRFGAREGRVGGKEEHGGEGIRED